ncbi:MAG TPA: hypothetical protein VGH13_24905 [Xanthobacteraceae bacterium]|jgi:hypothetical protein
MQNYVRAVTVVAVALAQTACGVSIPQIPEVWDLVGDGDATQHMEEQIKRAIFCELRDAILLARANIQYKTYYHGKLVSTPDDQPVPDSWGVQLTLTFTVDEASKLNPGASLIWPYKKPATSDSFTAGVGGILSSDATRTDKYETFYAVSDLTTVLSHNQICEAPEQQDTGPPSHSSPFVILSDLGIRKWLPAASEVSTYLRSSRALPNGEGPALGAAGSFASDSFSYDVKFVIETDANATPSWKLVRASTPTSPVLFDTQRTRTHELLITIGPAQTTSSPGAKVKVVGPSQSASNSHLAQEIGSAVASALRPALTSP